MLPRNLQNFAMLFHHAAEKGILLLVAAVFAILMANSELGYLYQGFLHEKLAISVNEHVLSLSFHHWINDFLMAIFFFVVGLEIKREMMEGHLSTKEQRMLPVFAAIGGVVVPVLIYVFFNMGDDVKLRGWAVPAATDIAFALGMLALFGKGLPVSLRVFLTALAIIDDLIAVVIIALFYSHTISYGYILGIAICIFILMTFNYAKIMSIPLYLTVGLVMWFFFLKSGIHATVGGVVLGFTIPLNIEGADVRYPPLKRLEKGLYRIVSYFILPLFAFANSGVVVESMSLTHLTHPIALGIILGLVVGKQLGIFSTTYLLVKTGVASLPHNTNFVQFYGVSILCGIGFTMSLFIGVLAFNDFTEYLTEVKIGVLGGSFISALLGAVVLKIARKYHPHNHSKIQHNHG